jgi:gliding motility-associated-like protein
VKLCKYVIVGKDKVSFKIEGKYDPSKELIIDPVVLVSSFSGSPSVSFGLGVAPDLKGNMYLYSMNMTKHYPATFGAVQTSYYGGFYDNALSKFNLTGTAKRFSTYIGGNLEEIIINCVIQNDEVAIFGTTNSDTFPIIKNGFQTQLKGKTDYFLIKIDTSGTVLKSSTYLGGQRAEGFSTVGNASWYYPSTNTFGELIMDEWNNCYVIGSSLSIDYPTTPGSFREFSDSNGFSDIVITKINSDLASLKWSMYYGGSSNNSPAGIKLSKAGTLYGVGTTNSKNFPTTPGVVHSTSVSTLDMFAFNIDTLSGFPISSTYIGAKVTEAIRFDLDLNDNVYIASNALSLSGTTVTPGAFNISTGSVFFYKLDPALTTINVIARFGYPTTGQSKIEIDAFNIDSCGYIYFGGFGHPGLPVTPDAFKSVSSAKGNLYLGVFNPNFTSLKFGSYYGGTSPKFEDHDDGGLNYFDDRGYFYHALCVNDDWPVTPGSYSGYSVIDSMGTGINAVVNSDAFVKIDLQTFVNANSSLGGLLKSCSPITATFSTNPNLGSVSIIPGDGSPAVNTNSLIHSYNSFGTYTALVVAGADSSTCNIIDSIKILVKYGAAPIPNLDDQSINCAGSDLFLDAGNPSSIYTWSTGETEQIIKPAASGMYKVKVENDYCYIRDSSQVTIEEGHDYSMPNAFTPNGDGDNDAFCLKGWKHCNQTFKIMIFSRWGEKVFESEDPNFCWNGYYNEKLLSADVYIYHLTAFFVGDKQINRKGNITLIR